jgi:hypothetical protein
MLVGADDGPSARVEGPVALALSIGLLVKGIQNPLKNAHFAPAVEAAGHGTPGAIAVRKISPRGAGAQNPSDAIEDGTMVMGGPPSSRFLGWEQSDEPLPLLVR